MFRKELKSRKEEISDATAAGVVAEEQVGQDKEEEEEKEALKVKSSIEVDSNAQIATSPAMGGSLRAEDKVDTERKEDDGKINSVFFL